MLSGFPILLASNSNQAQRCIENSVMGMQSLLFAPHAKRNLPGNDAYLTAHRLAAIRDMRTVRNTVPKMSGRTGEP